MYNYLICNTQDISDVNGNVLGKRVCDVSESTFPVSNDFEWKQHESFVNVYDGFWYWLDKPTEYVAPIVEEPPKPQPKTTGTQTL